MLKYKICIMYYLYLGIQNNNLKLCVHWRESCRHTCERNSKMGSSGIQHSRSSLDIYVASLDQSDIKKSKIKGFFFIFGII